MNGSNRANTFDSGIASEYYILSKLYRLDVESYITLGNKKTIDIRVVRKDNVAISIDVKAVRGYSSIIINNVVSKENHLIIVVVYNNKFDDVNYEPEVFIIPSIEIPEVTEIYGTEKRLLKGKLSKYKNCWENIFK